MLSKSHWSFQMREALLLCTIIAASSASVIEFVSLPKTISLPATSTVSELRLSQLSQLNENLLGLSAQSVQGFDVDSDLFSRPRAIAVIRVDGLDSLSDKDHTKYRLETDKFDLTSLDKVLASSFGADRESVTVDREGVSGSGIAQLAAQQQVTDDLIKTKLPILREELEQVYRLAAAIVAQGTKFEKSNAADIYRVTISGLSGKNLSDEERVVAVKDVENAIEKLASALSTAYGDQAIVEVVTISDTIKPSASYHHEETLVRRKRAVSDSDKDLETWRRNLNVYVVVSNDYPAIFAIFAGLSIILILAVLYTVVGMMSMDPSKDSIIYRMTTTRMKKA